MSAISETHLPKQPPSSVDENYSSCSCGHSYNCTVQPKKIAALVTLVMAATLIIFSVILSSGVFGGGKMGFIAGGLGVGCMISLGLSLYLYLPKEDPILGSPA